MRTLVIDTSYGSTVGITGHQPITEQDSRTHVEKLQNDIAQACAEADMRPHDIERIIVGIGPAPFTGLRAGIVAAKAIAYATGAQLLGQDSLTGQAAMMQAIHQRDPQALQTPALRNITVPQESADTIHITLSINDARRKQLYYMLLTDHNTGSQQFRTLIDMDIDTPANIALSVTAAVETLQHDNPNTPITVDIAGHGAAKYQETWQQLPNTGIITDHSLLDLDTWGLNTFAELAAHRADIASAPQPVEPLYLRRPDVSIPNPLKHVLNHGTAERKDTLQ